MSDSITIDLGFNGPPDSGQGGYTAGRLANILGGTDVEVTLRKPPPLATPMSVQRDGDLVSLHDGDTLIAEASPSQVEVEVPDPVTFADAETAARGFGGFEHHIFPTCMVCGTERAAGDGLRLFAGPVAGRDVGATPWIVSPQVADADGLVRTEIVWAALDCPSGWSSNDFAPGRPAVLGRIAAKLTRPIEVGGRYVVVGWPRGEDGRKVYAGSAVFDEDGALHAYAISTWIRLLKEPSAQA
jgi:hypothetical protein